MSTCVKRSAYHIGVRLFQQFQGMQCDVARRASPAHAEQCGIGQAGDNTRVGDRLGRRRVQQHEVVVVPQRLQHPCHRGRHQQAEGIRLTLAARNPVHACRRILVDRLGKGDLLLQTVHQPRLIAGVASAKDGGCRSPP